VRHPLPEAVLRALTLAPGIIPLGILFGATASTLGLSAFAAVALSGLVFAGAAQFAALGLVAKGASWIAATLLVLVINSRYFLLSAAALDLGRRNRASRATRVLIALGVVDESYALQAAWAKGGPVPPVGFVFVSATLWILWVGSTLAGAFVGNRLPDLSLWGLDYALPGIAVGLLGIFADTRARLLAGVGALGAAAALTFAGLGVVAAVVVPPAFAFALGRWAPGAE